MEIHRCDHSEKEIASIHSIGRKHFHISTSQVYLVLLKRFIHFIPWPSWVIPLIPSKSMYFWYFYFNSLNFSLGYLTYILILNFYESNWIFTVSLNITHHSKQHQEFLEVLKESSGKQWNYEWPSTPMRWTRHDFKLVVAHKRTDFHTCT